MKLNILSLIAVGNEQTQNKNARVAFFMFETEGAILSKDTEVCMSRTKPGGCNFSIEKLHEHNNHSPAFLDESEFATYMERVINDIRQVVSANGYEPDKDLSLVVDEKVIMPPTMLSMN